MRSCERSRAALNFCSRRACCSMKNLARSIRPIISVSRKVSPGLFKSRRESFGSINETTREYSPGLEWMPDPVSGPPDPFARIVLMVRTPLVTRTPSRLHARISSHEAKLNRIVPALPDTGVNTLIFSGRETRSEEHTSELQSRLHLAFRL